MTLSSKSTTLWLGLLLAPAMACAQGVLRDPTTPPPGAPRLAAGASEAGAVAPAAPQSIVRITPVGGARHPAVPAGQSLKPGEQLGPWRVVTITSHGVVLKDSRGTRTLATPSSSVRKSNLSGATPEQ